MTHLVLDAEATTDPAFGQRPGNAPLSNGSLQGALA